VRRAMQHVMDAIVPRAWTNHQATSWQIWRTTKEKARTNDAKSSINYFSQQ
jgi:hypothetical protein